MPDEMQGKTKNGLASRTTWGGIAATILPILDSLGVDMSEWIVNLESDMAKGIAAGLGLLLVIAGRTAAKQGVHWIPKWLTGSTASPLLFIGFIGFASMLLISTGGCATAGKNEIVTEVGKSGTLTTGHHFKSALTEYVGGDKLPLTELAKEPTVIQEDGAWNGGGFSFVSDEGASTLAVGDALLWNTQGNLSGKGFTLIQHGDGRVEWTADEFGIDQSAVIAAAIAEFQEFSEQNSRRVDAQIEEIRAITERQTLMWQAVVMALERLSTSGILGGD